MFQSSLHGSHSIPASDLYIEHREAMLREETLKARPSKPRSHLTPVVGVNAELGREKRPQEEM